MELLFGMLFEGTVWFLAELAFDHKRRRERDVNIALLAAITGALVAAAALALVLSLTALVAISLIAFPVVFLIVTARRSDQARRSDSD
jgi:Ca2+/Na+ antiporter